MRILLIRPRPDKETIGLQNVMICEPLELEYIGAYMESLGHVVTIIDMILEKKPLGYFIKEYHPEVVGITSYIAHVNVVKKYAQQIKRVDEACRVLVGGVHAEVVPEDFKDEHIDYVICGNGLKTFAKIVKSLEQDEKSSDIDGVWGEDKPGCLKENTFHYPHPNRSLVARYRAKYYYMFHNPCALIKTSYGCPYKCSFCFCREITDGKYWTRDLEDIMEELKSISEKEIYIVDDDFLVDRDRLLNFCSRLKADRLDKKFLIYGRSDFIADNEDVIKALASVGLRAVIVGLESSREEELKKYNKKSSVALNEKAISILKKYDVECYGTLILGVDWDAQDFNRLYQWIRKIDIKFINLQPFTPMPGTQLFDAYKDKLIISRKQYEKWDLAHLTVQPTKMSVRSYYWQIIKLYYKVTMHPRNIIKMMRAYGLKENLKLSLGASKITMQYFVKMFKN
ncbi:B12-binding domain-containing radical SAM protein [Cellulosilyticum sp. I15G10I2]|uniref:B12-binding domain-containing radical SAM protein n=1 Tax=Cellulosilyticum sp. I15G10I2 TaxID=1892843 RepID=UPI00085C2955|nr:radical SAM protein [Cellulosilyticum sp. I15G10I2]